MKIRPLGDGAVPAAPRSLQAPAIAAGVLSGALMAMLDMRRNLSRRTARTQR
jgi:hypothetical protein